MPASIHRPALRAITARNGAGCPDGEQRPAGGGWAFNLASESLFLLSSHAALRRAAYRTPQGRLRVFQF